MPPTKPLTAILFKLVNRSTFNAMRGQGAPGGGGGGQQDIRFGAQKDANYIFGDGPTWKATVTAVGTLQQQQLEANVQEVRNQEWRIRRQFSERHPAWKDEAGFPEGADPNKVPRTILWLAQTTDGEFYAGLLDADQEARLPAVLRDLTAQLSDDHTTRGRRFEAVTMEPARRAIGAFKIKPCVLLYGPPGTGKTRAMQEILAYLQGPNRQSVVLDPRSADDPFRDTTPDQPNFPGKVRAWWVTFHQGTTYEDFALGLRPVPSNGGVKLEFRAGPLLEALEHARGGNTSLLLIDEINRGNVARILGDFITFMEFDKRARPDGTPHPVNTIALTFPSLDYDPKNKTQSVKIHFADGERAIAYPYHVPYHVYVIGTMNSLDRSVAPLDTALARRFRRLDSPVDYDSLREHLTAKAGEAHGRLAEALLRSLNARLRVDFGEDFQLGHGYLWSSLDEGGGGEHTASLASTWDEEIFPQIKELYRTRPGELVRLLGADAERPGWPYRAEDDDAGVPRLAGEARLARVSSEIQERVLRVLAGMAEPGGEVPKPADQPGA
jgi:DNA polymerase III delta prime subunit